MSTLVLIYFGRHRLKHTKKNKYFRLLIQIYTQFWFFIKGSGTSFSIAFCVWFSKKMILMSYSTSWPNFIFSLSLLLEILGNTCIVIICCYHCDVINFEINYSFLIKLFYQCFLMTRTKSDKDTFLNKSGDPESLKNNHSSWEALQLMCTQLTMICWVHSSSCFVYGFMIQVISEKHCVATIIPDIWETPLYKNNCNYNSYKFNCKFTFIPFLSFRRNQKQESNFQQVGGLITRNISVFCF